MRPALQNDDSFKARVAQALSEVKAYSNGTANGEHDSPAFEPATTLLNREFPPVPWLIRGLLIEGAVSVVAGEPKSTKTWAALEMAMAIATATPSFGRFPIGNPRQVAIFLVEDDGRAVRNRLRSLAKAREMEPAEALKRIAVKCRGRLNLEQDDDLAWIIASARALPEMPTLLTLDPLRDLHDSVEDKSDSMAPVMRRLRLLRDVLGCAITFVHHAVKLTENSNARRPGQRMRGSGAIHAAVDGGLYLSSLQTHSPSSWTTRADVELKSARGAEQFSLRLDVTDNEEGEAVESWWTAATNEETHKQDDMDGIKNEVLQVLKKEWSRAAEAGNRPSPFVESRLAKQLEKANWRVSDALKELANDGLAERVLKGKKAMGWRYKSHPQTVRSGCVPKERNGDINVRSGCLPKNGNEEIDAFLPPLGGTNQKPERGVPHTGNES